MKVTPLLLTLAVFVLLAGGYLAYEKFLNKKAVSPWDLVPSETVLVYEKDVCTTCMDDMQKSAVWEIIQRASFGTKPPDSLQAKIRGFLENANGLLVSAHVIRKDDFDFVYYLPQGKEFTDQLSDLFPALKGHRYSQRELNKVRIHELSSKDQTFSWIHIDQVWVGSFTPFLIEDVIRTYNGKTNFTAANPDVKRLPRINGDAGNVYVQLKTFSDWLSIFIPANDRPYAIGKSSLLDIKVSGNNLVFNGFSTDSAEYARYLLSIFKGQSPVSSGLKNLAPNRTVIFTSYGINDGVAFSLALRRFMSVHKPQTRDSLMLLSRSFGLNLDDLYESISDEVAVCQVEAMSSPGLSKVLMIKVTAPELWINKLDVLSEKLAEDTVFYERYAEYVIRDIRAHRFPEKMLWPLVQGFDRTYYCRYGNIILIGENLEELKYFLEDIEHEDVWGKSVSKNRFLESTLLESNMSVFINTPKVWNVIATRLNPKWRHFVRENEDLLQSLQMSAFQFSHLNNTFYTNITINQSKERPEVAFASSSRRNVVHFSQPIQRLHAVKSHVNQANEILIQDSLNDLSLLSMEGKVLWTIPIGNPIRTEIQQIDFFANGKLQYIFSTRDAIHIIDRLGNYVDPYPLRFDGKEIQYLSLIDYDRSKRYRLLISEEDGRLWMYDKSGNNLEGWQPTEAGGALMAPPRHHRIKGKDYIIAIRKDGLVHLYNRRGELLPGFPLDMQGSPMGDYFLEMGNDIASSFFVIITRDGYRVRFNPLGKLQSRETLLRAYVGAQFELIAEKSGKSYLMMQHDKRQLTISDPSGRKILVHDYINPKPNSIKFYQYGSGKSFISLTDPVQEMSYVFDGNGALLTRPPLQSTAIELRMANSGQSYVFFIHDRSLTIQPLNP